MSFSDNVIQSVWQKAQIIINNDPEKWRKDQCGAWIFRESYGDRNSQYGWEVDHISPNGGDNLSNLHPLQWINNVEKSEGRLTCPVTSMGVNNIRKDK